jgi:hypothetical protein
MPASGATASVLEVVMPEDMPHRIARADAGDHRIVVLLVRKDVPGAVVAAGIRLVNQEYWML